MKDINTMMFWGILAQVYAIRYLKVLSRDKYGNVDGPTIDECANYAISTVIKVAIFSPHRMPNDAIFYLFFL